MGILLLNKKVANTILVLLVPILVSAVVQRVFDVTFGAWATVVGCLIWIVGLFLIWRPRRPRK